MKRSIIMPFLALPLVGCNAPSCSGTDVLALVQNVIDENLTTNWNHKLKSKHAASPPPVITISVERVITVEQTDNRVSCKATLVVHNGPILGTKQQFTYVVRINDDGKLYGTIHMPD